MADLMEHNRQLHFTGELQLRLEELDLPLDRAASKFIKAAFSQRDCTEFQSTFPELYHQSIRVPFALCLPGVEPHSHPNVITHQVRKLAPLLWTGPGNQPSADTLCPRFLKTRVEFGQDRFEIEVTM